MSIDINCDLGESYGAFQMGNDAAMMDFITSANIACGFHSGDYLTMKKTVRLCLEAGVSIGAHPGYPDIQGFGRRSIGFTPEEIFYMVIYQVGALRAIIESEGGKLSHIKPHGAMYNDAVADEMKALAIAEAVKKSGEEVTLLCLHNSAMKVAAGRTGIRFASEAFADRQYDDQGHLVSRTAKDSVITMPAVCASRTLSMITEKRVISMNGKYISINPDSICVHGDTPHSVEIAGAIRTTLDSHGITIKPFTGREKI